MILTALIAAASLPTAEECKMAMLEPEVAYSYSVGMQGFIYGYPIVDLLKQQHNETHITRANQPVAAPINRIAIYPGVLTPATQGELRAANADTLYLNGWFDLSQGPVLLDLPNMEGRYYTLAFMDLYAKPHHLGTRTNGGKESHYALIGPSGGAVPDGYTPFPITTDTAWMLGRVMVDDAQDEPKAKALAGAIQVTGPSGPPVTEAEPLRPFNDLSYFTLLNQALQTLPPVAGEAALMAVFDSAGFGPNRDFDPARLSPSETMGLGCAISMGPSVLAKRGFKPTQSANGWLMSNAVANPKFDYLLRAEIARGGYVNDPEESIYPAAVTDDKGEYLSGARSYRIRFAKGTLPPVDAFWSMTAYDSRTGQLTENPLRRYAISDRTKGLVYGADGSLEIILSTTPPEAGTSNWLPIPAANFHIVARLYLPHAEAVDGRYVLPPVERLD